MRIRILFLCLAMFLCGTGAPRAAVSEDTASADSELIELPFRDVPIAAFVTQKTLWLVANSITPLSPEFFRNPDSRFILSVKKLPSDKASVLLFQLADNFSVSVERSSGPGTKILLQRGAAKPATSSSLLFTVNSVRQPVLDVETKSAKDVIPLTDPVTGYELQVVPLMEQGSGFYPGRRFGKFSMLPSAQGIVVQKHAEDLAVSVRSGNVEIYSPLGLDFSPSVAEDLSNPDKPEEDVNPQTLFPYANWKLSDNKNFVPTEVKLFHDIVYGSAEAANKSRLRLLDIFLAQGLFVEAEGMADDILRVSYKFYRAHKVAALRGAAHFFMQHYAQAERDFSAPELADDKEAAMWLGLCRESLGEENGTFDFAGNYDRYISLYPPVFLQKLALTAAEFHIKHREFDAASEILDTLAKGNQDEPIRKYADYIRAEIFSETKNEDEAEKIWGKQAEMVDDPLIRASAGFSLINMQIREDKIAPEKAISELDKLRIVWRDDDLELSVLTLLASLYVDQKDYGKALHTMREIVQYFPESPPTLAMSQKMEQIFTMLYNKGGADNMPPLDALALFYEFRDLVPVGKDGDMMIRNLAERLVGIDLLDRAEMLLNHQVHKRLQGYERSRVGARLAEIYLQNHQTREALDTLKTTGYGELPPDLQLLRLRLTARALAAEGHPDKSIEVLSSDNSPEGMLLRLAIYWETKDWPNVTLTAEEILSNRTDPTAPLSHEESAVLLKLATAYVYEHDIGQIQYLRDYFTPLLKDNPDKTSFLFITSESGNTDYSNVSAPDSDIATMQSYLDSVRDEAKKGEPK